MKINYNCMPCVVNQVVKVSDMLQTPNREELFRKVFSYLSTVDFKGTTPEIIGETFRMIKDHVGDNDPYSEKKTYYNKMFLEISDTFSKDIDSSSDPFDLAVKYAVFGNIIDFNPIHNNMENIIDKFKSIHTSSLIINDIDNLKDDIINGNTLLYIGDNCGEICMDILLIKKIRELNPDIHIYFGVRGEAVVNDSTESDAYFVEMDKYATIISNGDCSLGTVVKRTSKEFQDIYYNADVIISKGQGNYESLSEESQNIYFLLFTKCEVIAKDIGASVNSMICMKSSK